MNSHRSETLGSLSSGRRDGFSLLEMLIALTLLTILVGLLSPALGRRSDSARLEESVRRLAATLQLARADALTQGRQVVVEIDAQNRTYRQGGRAVRQWERALHLEMSVAATARHSATAGSIRFYPDGTSSGADIVLGIGSARAGITVNWATGATRVVEAMQ